MGEPTHPSPPPQHTVPKHTMWKVILSCFLVAVYAAAQICPLPGPAFPAPQASVSGTAWDRATKKFLLGLKNVYHPDLNSQKDPAIDPDVISFTIQFYNARDSQPLFEYYHTATSARNNTIGVNKVDEDTVFRTASCSKVWTVLLLLIETGHATFHDPIVNYIPELREAIETRSNDRDFDELDLVSWDEVTIGELASQMSGIERQYGIGDLGLNAQLMESLGFPSLDDSDLPLCSLDPACTRAEFLSGILDRHPVFPVSSSPAYSNDAYQLLAYALETITGESYEELLNTRLIDPLGLSRSSFGKPDDQLGIIPVNSAGWDMDIGDVTPAGGIYSSTKDMTTVGRAILNHDLISPAETRRWLKPVAQTSEIGFLVGAPWEIFSLTKPRFISLYTKAGDIGNYSAMMGLSPDHAAGFTILAAGQGNTLAVMTIADLISKYLIPALDEVAKEEADDRFAGTYQCKSTNSSLIISTDDEPGLLITRWINNGKDILNVIPSLQLGPPPDTTDLRLFPAGLEYDGKLSFRSVSASGFGSGPNCGPITSACRSWMLVDGSIYGGIGMDEFVFETGTDGRAVGVSPRAMRVYLTKDSP
ncbi:beta-lactamase/transpeptidase-like protein [Aspergillus pseudoustus]|uniref:Beta-lactamase/transpeptidase-like protein n=1 Tax=Aspergillus pseudoustus TaxID=1810923 RepID=A0ABR4IMY7_9EURO